MKQKINLLTIIFLCIFIFIGCGKDSNQLKPEDLKEASMILNNWNNLGIGQKCESVDLLSKTAKFDKHIERRIYDLDTDEKPLLIVQDFLRYNKTLNKELLLKHLNSQNVVDIFLTLKVIEYFNITDFYKDIKNLDLSFLSKKSLVVDGLRAETFIKTYIDICLMTLQQELENYNK